MTLLGLFGIQDQECDDLKLCDDPKNLEIPTTWFCINTQLRVAGEKTNRIFPFRQNSRKTMMKDEPIP